MSNSPAAAPPVLTPSLKRRFISLVYEVFLVTAVEMFATLLFSLATHNRQDPAFQFGLRVYLFVVTGAYFVYCWTDSGHTLAMKTWRLKLVKLGEPKVPVTTAVARYLLAWGWFAPALLAIWLLHITHKGTIGLVIGAGMLAWGLAALFDKDRQFLHDRLAGTRMIQLPKPAKPGKPAKDLQPAAPPAAGTPGVP